MAEDSPNPSERSGRGAVAARLAGWVGRPGPVPDAGLPGRARRIVLLASLAAAAVTAAVTLAGPRRPLPAAAAMLGLAWLCWRWLCRYRRRRQWALADAGEALVVFGVGVAARQPGALLGLLCAALGLRALDDSGARVAMATALYASAYVAAVAWAGGIELAATIGALVLLAAVAAALHLYGLTAAGQQRSAVREGALAAAGAALVAARDREAIYTAARDAAAGLVGCAEDVGVAVLVGSSQRLTVVASAGIDGGGVEQATLDLTRLPEPLRARLHERSGRVVSLTPGAVAEVRQRVGLRGQPVGRAAVAAPIIVHGEFAGAIAVFRDRAVPSELWGGLETLAAQVALALERVAVTEDLHRREARFRSVVQNSSDVITVVDTDAVIRYQSPSVSRVLGYSPQDLAGTSLIDLVHPDDAAAVRPFFEETVDLPELTASIEWRLRHRDGTWRYVETVAANLLSDPEVDGFLLNIRDISERKALERQLTHRAFHDPLTNLANRTLFGERVGHALARARRERAPLAVIVLDLDNFKNVNDSLGHAAGDQLLVIVARRLEAELREGDTAARLGGDEFAVLLEPPTDAADASYVANRILHTLRAPMRLQGTEVRVDSSIGIAVSSPEPDDVGQLLRNADIAMYRAKTSGKGRSAVFEPAMHAAVLERLQLEAELEGVVANDELRLCYQPTVELHSGRVAGVEALVRWSHPRRGLVAPCDFIHLAEERGLIVPIGRWVLREACRQARSWQERLGGRQPLTVGVNLSANQLRQPDVVDDVARILQDSRLEPDSLVLEITESAIMRDAEDNVGSLRALKGLGIRLALDDFGTGYSSLGYLKRFPLDVLKIDKLFVDPIADGLEDVAFAHAIISLSEILGLQTVAEGIERPAQAARLRELGCELGQGYLFAKPLPAERIDAALATAHATGAQRWLVGDALAAAPATNPACAAAAQPAD